jgi:hypothetical protein
VEEETVSELEAMRSDTPQNQVMVWGCPGGGGGGGRKIGDGQPRSLALTYHATVTSAMSLFRGKRLPIALPRRSKFNPVQFCEALALAVI